MLGSTILIAVPAETLLPAGQTKKWRADPPGYRVMRLAGNPSSKTLVVTYRGQKSSVYDCTVEDVE